MPLGGTLHVRGVSTTLRLQLTVQARDLACRPQSSGEVVRDAAETTHDLVDASPVGPLATPGATGTHFVVVPTPVAQVQRLICDWPTGSDVIIRTGGTPASVLGASGALSLADGDTLLLAVDGGPTITATFLATDATPELAAKRINYAAGATVASVDAPTARLRLDGVKTGGATARSRARAFGAIEIVGGTAVAALGLTVGTTYGDGDDVRVGAGPLALTFPPGASPRRIELSGSASGARIWVAGTAA